MALRIFVSYSHDDDAMRRELMKHLAALKRDKRIESWYDREVLPGAPLDNAIIYELNRADIILLLVSASFIDSDYCYSTELARAVERSEQGEARAVPVILRNCLWKQTVLGRLKAIPRDGRAIASWPNQDDAYTDVAEEISRLVKHMGSGATARVEASTKPARGASMTADDVPSTMPASQQRTGNTRLKQTYSDLDKSRFLKDAFEVIAAYFERSLAQLKKDNAGVETEFTRVDAVRFVAAVYRDGKRVAECSVRSNGPGGFGEGITFSNDASVSDGHSYNELLSVIADGYSLHLKSLGFGSMTSGRPEKGVLSPEDGAEVLWDLLMWRVR